MLPSRYLISPEPHPDDRGFTTFLASLEAALDRGIRLVQLRAKSLPTDVYAQLAKQALACCERYDARLLLNASADLVARCGAHGQHLDGAALAMAVADAPAAAGLRSAATHSLAQIRRAEAVGVDFVTLSPVLATATHPDAVPLGWQRFAQLCGATRLPVYALGGMDEAVLDTAVAHGAHGIAAIRAFWQPH
ncbi:thiamine phosphate synthase [Chitinasiproducens palmae]|uniref:Thiamine-phosphate pyrophosphorylase n=1 Tax=Chitinasiproducens palmae TaxID=1770053 RepID=A0A1H2PVB9_9BURK|nr:thiamine phosphate synthase [Chitinasiproducens palmae]SDV51216.1 thiamine-phosphate pyrophosphorylase [Chitinasiproducens palmae]